MRKISIVFFTILVFQVISFEFKEGIDIFFEDNRKCYNAKDDLDDPSHLTTSKCNEVNPLLESKGSYKGECCKIIAIEDPLHELKTTYKEDWKKAANIFYDVDENISEEDLREMLISQKPEGSNAQCGIILDNKREVYLYEMSLSIVNKTFKYDCGSGEKTYNARNFNPKTESEIIDKDIADCFNRGENYSEKRCFKQGNKLLSDKVQCCWCDFTETDETSQKCIGARINEMKEFSTDFKKALLSVDPDRKAQINCRCVNKKNEMMNVNFDTVSDEIIIN